MSLPKRLAPRLILSLTALVVVVEGFFALMNIRDQEERLLAEIVLGADQLSKSITSATWHSMLADHRSAAYSIMETIATKQGIQRIRFFNKEGRVTFSTAKESAEMVDMSAEACIACHNESRPLVSVDVPSRARSFRSSDGHRLLGLVTPIYNEPACSNAACHAHPEEQKVLGVLDVTFDLDRVDRELGAMRARAALVLFFEILLIALFIILFTRRFVGKPIQQLIRGTKDLGEMRLDRPIRIAGSEDLQELSRSFDTMRVHLRRAVDDLNDLNSRLEERVEDRTKQLRDAQEELIRHDRLASLGRLSASVAHEINNPVAGILNLSMLVDRIIKDDGIPPGRVAEVRKHLSQMTRETTRVGRIVSDLLAFSRRSAVQRGPVDLNELIRTTVSLIAHKLELSRARVELDLDSGLPRAQGDSSRIQQVVMNLVLNAAESIQPGGTVTVRTAPRGGDFVVLEVRDTGAGIPREHLSRIFEPFFTTKPEGKGVGLGLAVVYGIVRDHGGEITVESEPGKGSCFRVTIPQAGREAPGPPRSGNSARGEPALRCS